MDSIEIVADSSSVVLRSSIDTKERTTVSAASLLDSYKLHVDVEKVVSDPLPVLSNPLGDHEAMLDYKKAQVILALRMLYVQYNNSQLALYVQSKPYQALFALEEFKAQSIVLVPFSFHVSVNI